MKWVTRPRCHIDRTACAWLIRRFVDEAAEFTFVSDPADIPHGAIAFDIVGQPFSHHDGRSTFEVMIGFYGIEQPGLARLAEIVHQADIEDDLYDAPEAPGLDAVIRGLSTMLDDDLALFAITDRIYDGLVLRLVAPGY